MARLTGCCCCFDNLRDGARAVGITLLVLTSLGLVSNIIGTVSMLQEEDNIDGTTTVPARTAGQTTAQIVTSFAVGILHIVMNALLVYGVNSSRRGMVLAWLIFFGIITGLESAAAVIVFIVFIVAGGWQLALVVLAVAAPLIGVFWYWFVVVLHYYKETSEQNGFAYGRQENDGEKLAM